MGKPQPESNPQDLADDKREEHKRTADDDLVDAQSEQSFPASDPPSWTLGPN